MLFSATSSNENAAGMKFADDDKRWERIVDLCWSNSSTTQASTALFNATCQRFLKGGWGGGGGGGGGGDMLITVMFVHPHTCRFLTGVFSWSNSPSIEYNPVITGFSPLAFVANDCTGPKSSLRWGCSDCNEEDWLRMLSRTLSGTK